MKNLSYTLYSPNEILTPLRVKIISQFGVNAEDFIVNNMLVVHEDNLITAVASINPNGSNTVFHYGTHDKAALSEKVLAFFPVK